MELVYCIDIGNTRTHCACVECCCGNFLVRNSFDYSSKNFAELFESEHLFENSGANAVSWCSVVPKYSEMLATKLDGLEAFALTYDKSPIELDIYSPSQLGQDRIADAVGAGVFLQPPYIVVDMGTAVTIDLVDAQGRYAGGAIAPGMNAFAAYLGERAAQLPVINPAVADCSLVIGKDTKEAMFVGCAKGFCKLIDGLIEDIGEAYFNDDDIISKTIFTGGSTDLLPKDWVGRRLINRDLAHIGLAKSYLINKGIL